MLGGGLPSIIPAASWVGETFIFSTIHKNLSVLARSVRNTGRVCWRARGITYWWGVRFDGRFGNRIQTSIVHGLWQ